MILVTGGSGFIGSLLAKTLVQRGKQVRVFDIIDFHGRPKEIDFVKGDIRNVDDIKRALIDVDTIYHNVALVPLSKAGKKFWDVNVTGTELLLQEAENFHIQQFIHVSSSAIFGTPNCPITNNTPKRPREIYGEAKLAGENLVKKYIERGHKATIIRPRTVLGNFRLGIFHILFEWISENKNIWIIGPGDNLFQFVHVDDLIDAMIRSDELGISGIYNIGTDRFRSLREDLSEFIEKVGSKSKIRSLPTTLAIGALQTLDFLKLSPLAPWHYLTYHKPFYFDVSEEKKILTWQPRYSNVEAFISSYQWYMKNRNLLKEETNLTSTHHSAPKQKLLKVLKWFS